MVDAQAKPVECRAPIGLDNNARCGPTTQWAFPAWSVVSRSCAVGCIDMTSGIAAWLVQPAPDWPDPRPTPTPLRIQGRFSCRVLSGFFFLDH